LKEILFWFSGLLAMALYIPLLLGIFRGKVQQSFTTWMLWVMFDVIALLGVLAQNGDNYRLLMCYVFGGTIVALSLLYMKQFKWTKVDTVTVVMVLACLLVWYFSGSKMAIVASSLAVFASGYPQWVDSRNLPNRHTCYLYLGYMVANFLSFLAGKEWTIADRFYFGVTTILSAEIARVSFPRKKTVVAIAT
jgi:hypothetical protein